MALDAHDRSAIQGLNREDVRETLAGLKRFTKRSKWIGTTNRYGRDTINTIARDQSSGRLDQRALAQYIAASSVLHSFDGWSYLGKSLSCLLRGDPHRAYHLAYYAELRAAMSLLATTGIGVFNNRHYIITAPHLSVPLRTRTGTHQFVWECLNYWAEQPYSGALFSATIRPYGWSLDEWLRPVGGATAAAPQARSWFLQWGVDLRFPIADRDARNESSYRPDGIPEAWSVDPVASLEFTRGLWAALEPSQPSRFDVIDRHVLRLALETVFLGVSGSYPGADNEGFRTFIERILRAQGGSSHIDQEWERFLRREVSEQDLLVFQMAKIDPRNRLSAHCSIASRATLLLRLAAGSTADLLRSSGYTADAISFWWEQVGRSRGLWEQSREPEDLLDLWADVGVLLEEVRSFQNRNPPSDQSFFRFGSELSSVLIGLTACERVALWALTPS